MRLLCALVAICLVVLLLGVPAYLEWQGIMTEELTEQVTQLLQKYRIGIIIVSAYEASKKFGGERSSRSGRRGAGSNGGQ